MALALTVIALSGCASAVVPGATAPGLDDNPDELVARGNGRAALALREHAARLHRRLIPPALTHAPGHRLPSASTLQFMGAKGRRSC